VVKKWKKNHIKLLLHYIITKQSLELRRLKAHLIMCFKILKGYTNITPSEFFTWSSSITKGHSMKLYYRDSRVTARQHFFLCSCCSTMEQTTGTSGISR